MTRYVSNVGNGSNTSFALTHGLATTDALVQVFRNSDGVQVEADIARTDSATVTVSFATAPTSNQYRVVIVG
jgi:hypothetical protein